MIEQIIILIWIHYVFDFIFQTRKMANNKSKSFKWLGAHVAVYTLPFIFIISLPYALINGALHFVTDAITSRMTSRYHALGDEKMFFMTIGLDQAIHITTLILTLQYFG